MLLPITTITAALLGLWLFWLSIRVIDARRSGQQTSEDETKLERRIRAQGNLSEYAPTSLVLLFLGELQGGHFWLLIVCASLLVVGRIIHGIAFSYTAKWVLGRVGGMILTFSSIIILALLNLWLVLGP